MWLVVGELERLRRAQERLCGVARSRSELHSARDACADMVRRVRRVCRALVRLLHGEHAVLVAADIRPAHVQRVGDGYIVTGVCVGDMPAFKPTRHMRIMRLNKTIRAAIGVGPGAKWSLEVEGDRQPIYGATLRELRIAASRRGLP